MPQFNSAGARVHYEIVGEGPPVLLVPGIASDGASWTPLIPLLAPRATLVLIDNRGAGRTRCEGALEVEDMVRDCAALIDHLRYEKVAVVGHSMGGLIGQRLAATRPDRVTKLATMGSSDRVGPKARLLLEDMAALYFSMEPQGWFRLLFQWLFSPDFFADEGKVAAATEASANYPFRQSPADFARQVRALGALSALEPARIRCPTLTLAGAADLLAPPSAVFSGHADIRQLASVVIENAAHSMHWEQSATVAEALAGFLFHGESAE